MAISPRTIPLAQVVEEACRAESNIFGYGIWTHHILSVVEYGKQLAFLLGADADIVEIAALLHDYASIKDQAMYQDHSVEEVIFRGYFLQRFRVDLGTTYAVLLSSFLFSLMHAPAMLGSGLSLISLLIGLASWFVFGIALSIGFLRTGSSLWFPWGLHYAYNLYYSLVGFGIAAIYHAPTAILYASSVWWVGNPAWAPESGLLGLLLEGALLAAVWVVTGVRLRKDERRTGELPISNV